MNVSFDFDGTLTKKSVQGFARLCKNLEFDVWIVTSRYPIFSTIYNRDLFEIASNLAIPRDQIIFTSGGLKKDYFKQFPDFIFHLDDDWVELHEIEMHTDVKAIPVFGNSDWEGQCWNAIQEFKSRIQ